MYNQAVIIANEETKDKKDRKESTAVALRLKPKSKLLEFQIFFFKFPKTRTKWSLNKIAKTFNETFQSMFCLKS